jgi:hypothetical protein
VEPKDQPPVHVGRIRRSHFEVNLAAGARWPGATDAKPDRSFRWVKIDNRGVNDLDYGWAPTFQGGDNLDSAGSVAPGTTRVFNTGDPMGALYISSSGGTYVHIELDDEPIVDLVSETINGPNGSPSQTTSLTSVASSATQVTLIGTNGDRRGLTIYNDSTQILYVAFASTVSTTSYTFQLGSQAYYEMPVPIMSGIITGLWAAANGAARITELT